MSAKVKLVLGAAVAVLAGCKQAAPALPLSQLNAQQMRGHAVFQTRCAVCHNDRKAEPLHGPPLLGVFRKKALPSGLPATDAWVTNTVVHGRNMMPALGNSVDAADVDDLLAYLHTL